MKNNEDIEFKKAIFSFNKIIIKKRKENIIINLDNIKKMYYAKFTIRNYLSLGFGDWRSTGFLYIDLKEKVNKKKGYSLFIRYKDIEKLPKEIYEKIKFYIPDEPW